MSNTCSGHDLQQKSKEINSILLKENGLFLGQIRLAYLFYNNHPISHPLGITKQVVNCQVEYSNKIQGEFFWGTKSVLSFKKILIGLLNRLKLWKILINSVNKYMQ